VICAAGGCNRQTNGKMQRCPCCQKRKWRANNPVRSAYNNLKNNADRRGKEFTISFQYFKKFVVATDYIKRKGRSSTCYHIDRIDESKGYIPGNLQLLTNAENNRKYVRYISQYDERTKEMTFDTSILIRDDDEDDCPF